MGLSLVAVHTLRAALPPLIAACFGALLFAWIAGWRVLSPTSIDWVLKLDWQHHFMGWHFFRNEPWTWPPGLIKSYYSPVGTAVGFTDSIPLVAISLKLVSSWLPTPLQYLGMWLLVCFALQGAMGALITGLWTCSPVLRVVGGTLFVVVPTLLGRVGHPALASHWVLLWAIFLYLRDWRIRTPPLQFAVLGLIAGLIHPYLAAMVLAMISSITARRLVDAAPLRARFRIAAQPTLGVALGLLAGWWCSGLLSIGGTTHLVSSGLDEYSMNLLGPIATSGWSRFLPQLAVASELQGFEGFQYLGLGLLLLISGAILAAVVKGRQPWRRVSPLVFVSLAMAIYSLSPRVTFGAETLFDYSTAAFERVAFFRATGRFFWPAAYVLLSLAVWFVVRNLRTSLATATLLSALGVQLADVSPHWMTLRATAHSEEFHTWERTLETPVWIDMFRQYRHIIFYPPEQCGPAPVPFLHAALLAGVYGLSVNTGHLARSDRAGTTEYCRQVGRDFNAGVVSDDTVYLVNRELVHRFRENAQSPVICAELDTIPVCLTKQSSEASTPFGDFR